MASQDTTDRTTFRLVRYAASRAPLPDAVVLQAKRLIIDCMGCAIGAFDAEPVRVARDLAADFTSKRTATVLGAKLRTTPDLAAFATATMVRYLDFNDSFSAKSIAHPSDNFGIVLAAAEAYGASGADLIAGFVIGYEVQAALSETHRVQSLGPWDQASYAAISAPLAVGHVMRLDATRLAHALRLSALQGLYLGEARTGELSHVKASAVANAGRNAIVSAMLAERGFAGPPQTMEGSQGFFQGLARQPIDLLPLPGEDGHDGEHRIMRASIKRFPAGFYSQTAIEGALECREALHIQSPEQVKRIEIRSFNHLINIMASGPARWRPHTRESADHSLPFVIAMAIRDGRIEKGQFAPENFLDPAVHATMDKIKVVLDPECDAGWPDAIFNIVTVETVDGRSHTAAFRHHKGHFRRPIGNQELEAKFRFLCDGILSTARQDAALSALWRLEEIRDLREFVDLFAI